MCGAARIRRVLSFYLVVALAAAPLGGCTLAGAGIGAGIDSMIPGPFEDHAANERVPLEVGERVDIGLRNGARARGRYRGTHGPTSADPETYLLVESDGAVASLPASELRVVGVETTGNGWIYGGVIG